MRSKAQPLLTCALLEIVTCETTDDLILLSSCTFGIALSIGSILSRLLLSLSSSTLLGTLEFHVSSAESLAHLEIVGLATKNKRETMQCSKSPSHRLWQSAFGQTSCWARRSQSQSDQW